MTQTKPFNYVELNTLKSWNCPVFKIFQLFCVQRRPMDPYETISFQMHKKRAQPVRSLLREITRYQIVWACSNSNASEWYVSNDIVKHWIMKKWRHNYHMCYLFSVHRCARLRLHTRFLFYTFFPLFFHSLEWSLFYSIFFNKHKTSNVLCRKMIFMHFHNARIHKSSAVVF